MKGNKIVIGKVCIYWKNHWKNIQSPNPHLEKAFFPIKLLRKTWQTGHLEAINTINILIKINFIHNNGNIFSEEKDGKSNGTSLRDRSLFLCAHYGLMRGQNARDIEFADMITAVINDQGPMMNSKCRFGLVNLFSFKLWVELKTASVFLTSWVRTLIFFL